MWARPKLSALPSEIMQRQVHATFQHDRALLSTIDVTGVESLLWGSDYPHFEGTWPNTQHELDVIFDGSDPGLRRAITGGNFAKLFAVPDAA
jgi:predicted TIM-barrel fold metal-dependent hydrolase